MKVDEMARLIYVQLAASSDGTRTLKQIFETSWEAAKAWHRLTRASKAQQGISQIPPCPRCGTDTRTAFTQLDKSEAYQVCVSCGWTGPRYAVPAAPQEKPPLVSMLDDDAEGSIRNVLLDLPQVIMDLEKRAEDWQDKAQALSAENARVSAELVRLMREMQDGSPEAIARAKQILIELGLR